MEQGDDSVLLFFTISKVKCQESFKEIEFWLVELATGRAVFFRERVVYALERKRENTTENDSSFFFTRLLSIFPHFCFHSSSSLLVFDSNWNNYCADDKMIAGERFFLFFFFLE